MVELLHPGVYVQELPSAVQPIQGVSTSTAAFIGVASSGPIPGTTLPNGRMAQPVLVTSFTEYQRRFGGFRQDSFLTYAAQSFFQNGGQRLYIVRIAVTAVTSPPASPPNLTAQRAISPGSSPMQISASNEGVWGNSISVATRPSSSPDPNNFKLLVYYDPGTGPVVVETYDPVTFEGSATLQPNATNPADYVFAAVNSRSEYIAVTAPVTARPSDSALDAGGQPTRTALANGSDGSTPQPSDYIGAPAADSTVLGSGLYALDKITDVNLIAIPGQGDISTVNRGVNYCKNERPLADCFYIGDMGTIQGGVAAARTDGAAVTVRTIDDAVQYATTGLNQAPPVLLKSAGDFGAIYYPWVWCTDLIGRGSNPKILLPPSGFVTGIYARIDNARGVFKAPAGIETGVSGALSVATMVSDLEQDRLNPISVNVIRTVPGSGFVVWGARTFGSDASWRYTSVRRMAIFLRVSIYYGIQWAVFEPNDEPLWAELRLNIRSFMLTQFRAGAFQGGTPDDAFFVKCDSSTTTQQDIDNGVVNILVGFAPIKPAEFVVLKLSQKVNQAAA
jgi:phage tail sheath protein FI